METTQDQLSLPWESVDLRREHHDASAQVFRKLNIPYKQNSNSLQTLDIWIPRDNDEQHHGSTVRDDSQPPQLNASLTEDRSWIVFIHGGAWRDPDITALSFEPTVCHVLQNATSRSKHALDHIAGFASINYSLSPYPTHSTSPSPPKDGRPPDPAHTAKHPQHLSDVVTALGWLQRVFSFNQNYILCGHSCGASIAFQTIIGAMLKDAHLTSLDFVRPSALLGLNGLYDLPSLVDDPGDDQKPFVSIYESFIKGAFGPADDEDRTAWKIVSPALYGPGYRRDWEAEWPEGRYIALAQSKQDGLVPGSQTFSMLKRLEGEGQGKLRIIESSALNGDHDHAWKDGRDFALILEQAIAYLVELRALSQC